MDANHREHSPTTNRDGSFQSLITGLFVEYHVFQNNRIEVSITKILIGKQHAFGNNLIADRNTGLGCTQDDLVILCLFGACSIFYVHPVSTHNLA